MTKKSGLGDSPLFSNPSKQTKPNDEKQTAIQVVEIDNEKGKKEQKRTNVRTDERTNERMSERTSVQTNERTNVQGYRVIKRHPYDFYLDQIHSIEDEVVKRSRQTGQNVTLGEVIREIIDFYFSKKKK